MEIQLDVLVATATAYGAVATKLVDVLRNTVGKLTAVAKHGTDGKGPAILWQLCSFGIGIGMAYLLDLNVFEGESWGTLATGFAIGAAGSGYHELFDALSGVASARHETAEAMKTLPGKALPVATSLDGQPQGQPVAHPVVPPVS